MSPVSQETTTCSSVSMYSLTKEFIVENSYIILGKIDKKLFQMNEGQTQW